MRFVYHISPNEAPNHVGFVYGACKYAQLRLAFAPSLNLWYSPQTQSPSLYIITETPERLCLGSKLLENSSSMRAHSVPPICTPYQLSELYRPSESKSGKPIVTLPSQPNLTCVYKGGTPALFLREMATHHLQRFWVGRFRVYSAMGPARSSFTMFPRKDYEQIPVPNTLQVLLLRFTRLTFISFN